MKIPEVHDLIVTRRGGEVEEWDGKKNKKRKEGKNNIKKKRIRCCHSSGG